MKQQKLNTDFISLLAAPALANEGITTLQQLAERPETELLKLHGIEPSSLTKLRNAPQTIELNFKK